MDEIVGVRPLDDGEALVQVLEGKSRGVSDAEAAALKKARYIAGQLHGKPVRPANFLRLTKEAAAAPGKAASGKRTARRPQRGYAKLRRERSREVEQHAEQAVQYHIA